MIPEVELPEVRPVRKGFHNPYRDEIRQFPDRIFLFEDFEDDIKRIHETISGKQIVVEFGCGSGQHLIARASLAPDVPHLGFEIRYKRCVRAVEKSIAQNVKNLFILRLNAREMSRVLPPNSTSAIYALFPDPWNKRRERKNRLLTRGFLNECATILDLSGSVYVKTDQPEYFAWFKTEAEASQQFVVDEISEDLHQSPYASANINTEFELMFLSQQLPIHYAKLNRANAI